MYCRFLELLVSCGLRRFFVICKKYTRIYGRRSNCKNVIDIDITVSCDSIGRRSGIDSVLVVTVASSLALLVSLLSLFIASFKIVSFN